MNTERSHSIVTQNRFPFTYTVEDTYTDATETVLTTVYPSVQPRRNGGQFGTRRGFHIFSVSVPGNIAISISKSTTLHTKTASFHAAVVDQRSSTARTRCSGAETSFSTREAAQEWADAIVASLD